MRPARAGRSRAGAVVLVVAVALLSQVGAAVASGLVTGRQIEDGTVTGTDVRAGSVSRHDVADGSLRPVDVAQDMVGETGPAGPPGPAGNPGIPGLPGVRGVVVVSAPGSTAAPGSWSGGTAFCPSGKQVLSGGFRTNAPDGTVEIVMTAPRNDGRGWMTSYHNAGDVDVSGDVWAVCAFVL